MPILVVDLVADAGQAERAQVDISRVSLQSRTRQPFRFKWGSGQSSIRVNFIQALEATDKEFSFIPLLNLDHSFQGDGLVAALSASEAYFARCLGQRSSK